jgi:hypothetical protein
LWLAAALLSAPASAQDPAWGLEALMRLLAQRAHSQASFVETKSMRLLSRPITSRGTLTYAPSGRLEKRTLSPNDEVLLVDGDQVSIELKARGIKRSVPLQRYPALWGFVESLRATLRGDLETLQRFYRIELAGEAGWWRITLVPLDARMGAVVEQIRIGGAGGKVRSVEILEARGDRSLMEIREGGS